jgi:hypothetical protein
VSERRIEGGSGGSDRLQSRSLIIEAADTSTEALVVTAVTRFSVRREGFGKIGLSTIRGRAVRKRFGHVVRNG